MTLVLRTSEVFGMLYILVLLALLECIRGDDCVYPNGTDAALHFYNCENVPKLTVIATRILDTNLTDEYPVNFGQALYIDFSAKNQGGSQYTDYKINITMMEYDKGWSSADCSWRIMPLLSIINEIDGCTILQNCPLTTGNLDFRVPIDLSMWGWILTDKAYSLTLKLIDQAVKPEQEIGCFVVQMKAHYVF